MNTKSVIAAVLIFGVLAGSGFAAGILTPLGAGQLPIQIQDHTVNVVINNGFACTEVIQTFHNPNQQRVEAVYSFPLPKSASLSELSIYIGEQEIHGEVVEKLEADKIYQDEKQQGNDAGLAAKNEYKTFEFRVSGIEPLTDARVRFLYYQPLELDAGVGRYLYPLADGGTDELAQAFWSVNEKVEQNFNLNLELKSAWPLAGLRVPGFENSTNIIKYDERHYGLRTDDVQFNLARDFVLYYMLEDNLPGRVELLTYRDDPSRPGTFMLVLTPGLDLKSLNSGTDYIFVLDISGSMASKIGMVAEAMKQSITQLNPADRFSIVVFNNYAQTLTNGLVAATPENVQQALALLSGLREKGGTNLFAGIFTGLQQLDNDRATNFILVTDAVANQGVIHPAKFHELLKQYDVRFFGFLIGNNTNLPLMRAICEGSDGQLQYVSTADDIVGQLALAQKRLTHECLHDAQLKLGGVETFNVTGDIIGRVNYGEQLTIFGQYKDAGEAALTLKARLTGEDKVYQTRMRFPAQEELHPELERLWALSLIEQIELKRNIGQFNENEAKDAIKNLGVEYQLVTDYTSMLALSDEKFKEYGIDRRNLERAAREKLAAAQRSQLSPQSLRIDEPQPMFQQPANHVQHYSGGSGAGPIDPLTAAVAALLAGAGYCASRRKED